MRREVVYETRNMNQAGGSGETAERGMRTPCLNIILLEVTMRALVCPSPLDLITNSANRAISSPHHLSDGGRWIGGKRGINGRETLLLSN